MFLEMFIAVTEELIKDNFILYYKNKAALCLVNKEKCRYGWII
jgi:hypothetical protein